MLPEVMKIRGEKLHAVFYLTDSFVILSSLLLFFLPVALGYGAVLVRAGKGIEYLCVIHVLDGTLPKLTGCTPIIR